jgi:hypothetical protein
MRFPSMSRRPSLDAALAYDSPGAFRDSLRKLLCNCFEAPSDRATVGSLTETDASKSYILLNHPDKVRCLLARRLEFSPSSSTKY